MSWKTLPISSTPKEGVPTAWGGERWLASYDPNTDDQSTTENVFCPTGEGGGVDATCSPGGSKADAAGGDDAGTVTLCDPCHEPDVEVDSDGDGVTDVARVGVHAMEVPPPPPIGRLPNLTPRERAVERAFVEHYENNPDQVAADFREVIRNSTKPGDPPTFGTDDAKHLSDSWTHPDQDTRAENRATLNLALHQTANAICKRAFLQELDTLAPGSEVLVTVGGCGCHVIDTPIMMSDGSSKMVQDIEVGDELMGPDSKPRRVQRLIRGVGDLYDIVPKKGKTFRVNSEHVLSLHTKRAEGRRDKVTRVEMTVREYLQQGKGFRNLTYLHRTGVEFPTTPVVLDPYFLGIWLGNGTHSTTFITTADEELVDFLQEFAAEFSGTELVCREKDGLNDEPNKAKDYGVRLINKNPGKGVTNPVLEMLRVIGVYKNKHIPQVYLRNDRETRLRLLAGLLDTDGYTDGAGMCFSTKYDHMAYNVAYLARSLGFAAYVKSRWIKTDFIDEPREYWGVTISGDLQQIPMKVVRKSPRKRTINKDPLRVGFEVRSAGRGNYYGFTLSGDGLYLLDDFTVTHNSGKGFALKHVPQAMEMKKSSAVVWDSAGDQNATENPWIQKEAEARGLKVNYLYVHADPETQWAHPERGVVKRAGDPSDGRMVDAKVFADSYALGARNHQAFYEKNRDNPNAKFMFLANQGGPKMIDGIPREALNIDRTKLADFAVKALSTAAAPERVIKGGSIGERVWPKKD